MGNSKYPEFYEVDDYFNKFLLVNQTQLGINSWLEEIIFDNLKDSIVIELIKSYHDGQIIIVPRDPKYRKEIVETIEELCDGMIEEMATDDSPDPEPRP